MLRYLNYSRPIHRETGLEAWTTSEKDMDDLIEALDYHGGSMTFEDFDKQMKEEGLLNG